MNGRRVSRPSCPTARRAVDVSALPLVAVTITWTPPNEQQHTYATTSAIATN